MDGKSFNKYGVQIPYDCARYHGNDLSLSPVQEWGKMGEGGGDELGD